MPSTRTGKIGRLPKTLRDEIGQRIENGQLGVHIVAWLNQQEGVHEILKEHFDGRPINEQNLSDWKLGGHVDWVRHRDAENLARFAVERSNSLEHLSGNRPIGDHFATVLAMDLNRFADELVSRETDPVKRWEYLSKVHREFSRLRRDDHQGIRTSIQRQRWERQIDAEEAAAGKQELAQRHRDLINPIHARIGLRECAEKLGGTRAAWNIAALIQEVNFGLALGCLGRDEWPHAQPDPGKSFTNQEPDQAGQPSNQAGIKDAQAEIKGAQA